MRQIMNISAFHRCTFGAALALIFLLSSSAYLHAKENVHEAAMRDSAAKLNEINRQLEEAKENPKKAKALAESAKEHILSIKQHVDGAEIEKDAKKEIDHAADDALLFFATEGTINEKDVVEFKKVASTLVATIHKHFKVKFPKFIRKLF